MKDKTRHEKNIMMFRLTKNLLFQHGHILSLCYSLIQYVCIIDERFVNLKGKNIKPVFFLLLFCFICINTWWYKLLNNCTLFLIFYYKYLMQTNVYHHTTNKKTKRKSNKVELAMTKVNFCFYLFNFFTQKWIYILNKNTKFKLYFHIYIHLRLIGKKK